VIGPRSPLRFDVRTDERYDAIAFESCGRAQSTPVAKVRRTRDDLPGAATRVR